MDFIWTNPAVVVQTQIIARSLKHWTGRELLPEHSGFTVQGWASQNAEPETLNPEPLRFADKIFHASFVLVSHGTEADPVLNYGNAAALALWEMSWAELTHTPSRLTAEAPNRGERGRLLDAVTQRGFIDDYSGVRISRTGRRFKISRATVWNLISENGRPCGQAAMFGKWELL